SFAFKASIVPTASSLMIRSEFANGASILIEFNHESIFLVFIGSKLLFFLKDSLNRSSTLSVYIRVFMLCYIVLFFYEMTPRPYILIFDL
ncbi:hypothetical protein M569_00254, partial [Genlisea aurea]